MALERFETDDVTTVYDKVKNMTLEEFRWFITRFYANAWKDGTKRESDERYYLNVYPSQSELFPWENDED